MPLLKMQKISWLCELGYALQQQQVPHVLHLINWGHTRSEIQNLIMMATKKVDARG